VGVESLRVNYEGWGMVVLRVGGLCGCDTEGGASGGMVVPLGCYEWAVLWCP
jgi:hypothetical protein